jgi:hypothetical protein
MKSWLLGLRGVGSITATGAAWAGMVTPAAPAATASRLRRPLRSGGYVCGSSSKVRGAYSDACLRLRAARAAAPRARAERAPVAGSGMAAELAAALRSKVVMLLACSQAKP